MKPECRPTDVALRGGVSRIAGPTVEENGCLKGERARLRRGIDEVVSEAAITVVVVVVARMKAGVVPAGVPM